MVSSLPGGEQCPCQSKSLSDLRHHSRDILEERALLRILRQRPRHFVSFQSGDGRSPTLVFEWSFMGPERVTEERLDPSRGQMDCRYDEG